MLENIMKNTVFFVSYGAIRFGQGLGPLKGTYLQHDKNTLFFKVQKVSPYIAYRTQPYPC